MSLFGGLRSIATNVIGLNAVGVHTELNGTSGSMLSQMLKGTPCLLRFSPCYGIGGGFGEIRKGQKPVRYELVRRITVSTPPLYHNGCGFVLVF